ncbi:MAG: hypothetical protein UW64_C0028G0004 [Microgenomates group bacterium GW2011_GWC1_44_37]|uniref:Uncharacterized protein n=1 Tax=Candidatus Collierbacteria bacterium GW2011_GWB2_44_22 TaxID=1618387 RepID=A0A0G1K517_9BACT|nr:MAG: hypothetical protein UW31_C0006G0095 [Candidatus Collierbacteria bacterium GW2011_GWA2_44_13]KKT48787.1 MAG: hypothetical protein UW42_C0047G0004 [Candidatus Collierbacteria bacterium GW2011_GWB1_44_197]KKT51377.1 MAG: hypothetical protein UW44_C0013G0097 [Candidatus Collierbacteria bacterium GW2011_GWB2_44_22]KKT64486.1 MAG: hypothetical protein UW58_C0042G0007 [Candidatus Collierbacteria bacterium GW2011_GWC2_44_30]KKT68129.1 MAG: hypothetical protein UW64_C0028G0004 [Microgenomates g
MSDKIKEVWKQTEREIVETEGDLEFAFLEMMLDFLPPELVADMEEKWTEVIPYDENELEGRDIVELPELDEIMIMTREVRDDELYYAMWKKI